MINRLEADGIALSFGTRQVLKDIYLRCDTGKVTGLLARNGQGKTCLMNVIYGNLKAQSRSIRFNDNPMIEAFKRPDVMSYLPQFNFIPPSLSLRRVFLDFDLPYAAFETTFPEFEGRSAVKFSNLSGGQRRLTEVYLLVKSKAQFTLLDEPFSHLMPPHVEQIKALITAEKQHKGFLITDHLFHAVVEISDSLYILKDGKTHLTNSMADLEWLGYVNANS